MSAPIAQSVERTSHNPNSNREASVRSAVRSCLGADFFVTLLPNYTFKELIAVSLFRIVRVTTDR
jgi:hypothetical protein